MKVRPSLAKGIREAADEACERCRSWWLVSLHEPTSTLFVQKDGHDDLALLAVLFSNRISVDVRETTEQGTLCVLTSVPVCVLGVPEEFMAQLMRTIRANGIHGRYKEASTGREYPF